MDTLSVEEVAAGAKLAAGRIASLVRETPLAYSPFFSEQGDAEVFLKLENLQHTGSFKLRGAANCLLSISAEQRARGCIAASSGNHGAALAYAMRALHIGGVIFVPEKTSAAKVEAIRRYGGDVRFFGTDGLDTELHARTHATEHGLYYVSPYNDAAVIAGQGTCGIEMAAQLPALDAAFIAVGGGGLMSGVGSVLKTANPGIRLFGCQPEASAVMAKSVRAGQIIELPGRTTLSDGTAGGIEPGSLTFGLCATLVDEFVLVGEDEIATAMRQYVRAEGAPIEGAAGVALAGFYRRREAVRGLNVAIIICGGNVSEATLAAVLSSRAT
jgi:threonine dehydratase